MNHKINTIISSLIVTLIVFFIGCGTTSTSGQIKLSPPDFENLMNSVEDPQIIDVRTWDEYFDGHISNAVNLDIYADDFDQKLDLLNKSDTVFVYCKSGGRSGDAAKRLIDKGFKNVFDLDGGMLKWEKAKLPIEGASDKSAVSEYSVPEYDSITSSQRFVLVDFYAQWCGPCKKMAPYLKKMKDTHAEEQLKIVKIDIDKNARLMEHFNISGIPLFKIYHNGKQVVDQLGYVTEEDMMLMLKPYL